MTAAIRGRWVFEKECQMSGRDVKKATVTAIAAAILLGAGFAAPVNAKPAHGYTKVLGLLECTVESGVGYILVSNKSMVCTFKPKHGKVEWYKGRIEKYGIDVGFTAGGYFAWAVLAKTSGKKRGALVGNYGGLTAEATLVGGLGANVLLGGNSNTIALQPVSVQAQVGLNLAAGVAALTLRRP
jgi:hypothetical protein